MQMSTSKKSSDFLKGLWLGISSTQHPKSSGLCLSILKLGAKAKKLIESCEHCNPEGAEIPFDNILDRVTGSDPSVTDYILETPGKCPRCFHQINEKTLVEPNDCEN